jgi:hypothetical protein
MGMDNITGTATEIPWFSDDGMDPSQSVLGAQATLNRRLESDDGGYKWVINLAGLTQNTGYVGLSRPVNPR